MKRFTETTEWEAPFFQRMSAQNKLAWLYINSHCDCAGVIHPNPSIWSAVIGVDINLDEFKRAIEGKFIELPCGSWIIKGFIRSQYGDKIKEDNSVHRGILRRLAEAGIVRPEPLLERLSISLLRSLKDQAKDKDQDKAKNQVQAQVLDQAED